MLKKDPEWYKKLNPVQRMLYKELYRKDFYEFFKEFWDTFESAQFVDGPLLQFYCEMYQYFVRDFVPVEVYNGPLDIPGASEDVKIIDVRQNKRNLCLNVPPSHTKSACLNAAAGVWTIINIPMEIASVSHTEGLSTEMNKKRQRIMNSEKFKFFFPEIELVENSASKLVTNSHANLYSVNRNAFTGYHASIIIADDITNARTALRDKLELQNATSFYRDTLPSRLSDPLTGIIMNIQQRLSNSDITSTIENDIELRNQYTFVVLPAEFDKDTYLVCPISGTVFYFSKGSFLWPQRFGNYESLKGMVGINVWNTQYLQKPVSRSDSIIKESMIIEKDATEVPGWDISNNEVDLLNIDRMYISNDFPVKKTDKSDFLGSTLAYKVKRNIYIFDCIEERQNFPDSMRYIRTMYQRYPGAIILCEDKANGSSLIDTLKEEVPGMIAFNPGLDSKEDRLNISSTWFESGNVIFVKTLFDEVTKTWKLTKRMENLKQKLLDFPAVLNDDCVDSTSMLVLYVFNDLRYCVYGKSFNEYNIVDKSSVDYDYSTTFFNKIGDEWKVLDIGIKYDLSSQIVVLKETTFVASIENGLKLLKEFTPEKNVFIDCSDNSGLQGIYREEIIIEPYEAEDLELGVGKLNVALGNKKVLFDSHCKQTQSDLENFKYNKKDTTKFRSTNDGFIKCVRTAMKYYGGI